MHVPLYATTHQKRTESLAIRRITRRQAETAERAPMEPTLEHNEIGAARGMTCQLDGILHGFTAAVDEEKVVERGRGHELV